MKIQNFFSAAYFILGLVTIGAGVIHFAMMGFLTRWTSKLAIPENSQLAVGSFQINHITSGVLVILVGVILSYASRYGLSQGKQWGAAVCLLIGFSLIIISSLVWIILPKQFLSSPAFVAALASLTGVGLLVVVPLLIFWKQFNQP